MHDLELDNQKYISLILCQYQTTLFIAVCRERMKLQCYLCTRVMPNENLWQRTWRWRAFRCLHTNHLASFTQLLDIDLLILSMLAYWLPRITYIIDMVRNINRQFLQHLLKRPWVWFRKFKLAYIHSIRTDIIESISKMDAKRSNG